MPVLPVRVGACLMVVGLAALGVPLAQAEGSVIDLAATMGGQIIGAAKACGINNDRIRRASERMASVVIAKAPTRGERDEAAAHFQSAQAAGAEQVRFEKSRCTGVHVEFAEMEAKLGRAPSNDDGRLAAKRGVPALGAIHLNGATRSE